MTGIEIAPAAAGMSDFLPGPGSFPPSTPTEIETASDLVSTLIQEATHAPQPDVPAPLQSKMPTEAAVAIEFFAVDEDGKLITDANGEALAFNAIADIPSGSEIVGLKWQNEDGSIFFTTKFTTDFHQGFYRAFEFALRYYVQIHPICVGIISSDRADRILEIVILNNRIIVKARENANYNNSV